MSEPRKRVRVLIADDTADMRLLLRSSLGLDDRFEVVAEASDGVESIREAARHRPDVVLIDVAMPLMDGLEAIPAIRRRSPESKIVVLSVFPSERMSGPVLEAGADAYLEKSDVQRLVPMLVSLFGEEAPGSGRSGPEVDQDQAQARRRKVDPASEMLQGLAHELMSPVTVILRLAEMVRTSRSELTEETIDRCLESIGRNASHMANLIQSLSDAHRVEAGMLALDPRPTDLGILVQEAVADLDSMMEDRKVHSSLLEGVVISVDRMRIRQVLNNLLTNAAKFTPEGSRVTVEMTESDQAVEIAVLDEGPGIPAEGLARAFDKFSPLSRERKGGGLGLGLYIARGIVRAHGGELTASGSAGSSRFTVRLPKS